MVKVINCRLTGLDPGSGYQSIAVCLPYSDLNQVPVSPKGAYSLRSMHYWCKATLHDPSLEQTSPSCCLSHSHANVDHYSASAFVTHAALTWIVFLWLCPRLMLAWNTSALLLRLHVEVMMMTRLSVNLWPCKAVIMSVWSSNHSNWHCQ